MLKQEILQKLVEILEKEKYKIAPQICSSCFDILARGERILIIKVLTNVDSLYEEQAEDMIKIAHILSASPLVVGVMARGRYMKNRTIYERYGIPAVNLETFEEIMIEKKFPLAYAKKGGFYAYVNPKFLREIRKSQNFSLGDLAREAGISKTTLINYEKGKGAEIDSIIRLQNVVGELLLDTINPFNFIKEFSLEKSTENGNEIKQHLDEIGFKTTTVEKASFKMIGKHKNDLVLTGVNKKVIEKEAIDISCLKDVLDQHGMIVLEKTKKTIISGVPVLSRNELKEVVSSKELLKILKEIEEEV